jgi:acetone carboxylase gamma subunit
LLLYVIARFGNDETASGYLPQDVLSECKAVVQMHLPWRFPLNIPSAAHKIIVQLAGEVATPERLARCLVLHPFVDTDDLLASSCVDLKRQMAASGQSNHVQLRSLFLAGRLRDDAVIKWMLSRSWVCNNSGSLAEFILDAPASKVPGSLEITLMGKETRNAAAAVPLWPELREADKCWTQSLVKAVRYTYVHICMHMYVYIYIYRERERCR